MSAPAHAAATATLDAAQGASVEPIKLASSGTFQVTAIDASRARLQLVHVSTAPSVLKEELTETLEIVAKDKTSLVFPGNAVLTSIP